MCFPRKKKTFKKFRQSNQNLHKLINIFALEFALKITVRKLQKFTLTRFRQKIRENKTFLLLEKLLKELVSRKKF